MNNFFSKLKNNKWLHYLLFFCLYAALAVLVFWNKIPSMTSGFGMPDIDTDGTLWYQWFLWFNHHNKLPFQLTNLIAFPYGYDLSYAPFQNLIQSVQGVILNIIGFSYQKLIFLFNFFALLSFPLSAIGAYSLSYYFTKNKLSSFLSGIIFSFSFYHILQARGVMPNLHWEFVPFYFLSLFYFLDTKKNKALILSVTIFALMFNAYSYFAFFSGILSLVIFICYGERDKISYRAKLFLKYYGILFLVLIALNLNFILSNLFMLNQAKLTESGRAMFDFSSTFIKLKAFFLPPSSSLIYRNFNYGEHPIGYISILIFFFSLIFGKLSRLKTSILICLLVSIVLCASIPGFGMVNKLYFDFFSAFRSVAYFMIFILLFVSLFAGLAIDEIRKYKFFKDVKFYFFLIAILFIGLLFEGLNNDRTFKMNTDFSNISEVYKEINQIDISNIVMYPGHMNFQDFGFPIGYQELGQIASQKNITVGANPSNKESQEFEKSISDINDSRTIDILKSNKIDAVLLYNYYLENAGAVNTKLMKDARLQFVGRYNSHDNTVTSAINNSLDISIYKIKDVKKNDFIYSDSPEALLSYKKINSNKYKLRLKNINRDFKIALNFPYSGGFVMKNNFFSPNISENTKESYYNTWLIKPSDFKGADELDINIYFKKGIAYDIRRYFSLAVFLGIIIYLLFNFKKNGHQNGCSAIPHIDDGTRL